MAWQTQEKAGRRFDILLQEQEAECGPCCVAMIANLMGHGKPRAATVRSLMSRKDYKASTSERAGMVRTALSAVRPEAQTHSEGTYAESLGRVLTGWGITNQYCGPSRDVRAAIIGARAGKPIICHVDWGHWVVITHSMGLSHYVLDPAYGLQINSSPYAYQGLEQSEVSAGRVEIKEYGTWTGEWLKVI